MKQDCYELIDSGEGRKLEQVGKFLLDRPCSQALWKKTLSQGEWDKADAMFTRQEKGEWKFKKEKIFSWNLSIEGISFQIQLTDFGHLGVFPEHAMLWKKIREKISKKKNFSFLNLFAYTGGATLIASQAGAKVCHVDASKPTLAWARQNAELNHLSEKPIRWIVDDVFKFLQRELRRGEKYDGILLDPPTFGRGTRQEVFKIERDILPLLESCQNLLSSDFSFFIFSCHTPGFTPLVLQNLLEQTMKKKVQSGELFLLAKHSVPLPFGSFAVGEGDA